MGQAWYECDFEALFEVWSRDINTSQKGVHAAMSDSRLVWDDNSIRTQGGTTIAYFSGGIGGDVRCKLTGALDSWNEHVAMEDQGLADDDCGVQSIVDVIVEERSHVLDVYGMESTLANPDLSDEERFVRFAGRFGSLATEVREEFDRQYVQEALVDLATDIIFWLEAIDRDGDE